jgi:hypothetical protein
MRRRKAQLAMTRQTSTPGESERSEGVKIAAVDGLRWIEQPLTEVINQCATMERLLDALPWAQVALPDHEVVLINPTTSSKKSGAAEDAYQDNDLILENRSGQRALFEVSDVVSEKVDGNSKEQKDLKSLGVLPEWKYGDALRFLVVSKEFGKRIARAGRKTSGWKYLEPQHQGDTYISKVQKRIEFLP